MILNHSSHHNFLNKFLLITASVLVLLSTQLAEAYTPLPGSPLANRSHPRLLITQASIPTLRAAIAADSGYASKFQEYVNWAANPGDANGGITEVQHDPLRSYIIHQAFIYALGNVPGISYPISTSAFARLAIDNLLSSLNGGAELGYAAPLIYDWTYNAMTATERSQVATLMLNRTIKHSVFTHSIANPSINPQQMFSSKFYEGLYAWYLGLAFWGDGLIDAAADQAVDTFYDVMLNYGYLDAHNFVADQGGGWSEWNGYSSWHPRTLLVLINGWVTATNENYIAGNGLGKINGNAIKHYGEFIHYAVDPHKYFDSFYTYVRLGSAEIDETTFEHRSIREQLYLLPRMLFDAGLTNQAGLVRNFVDTYEVQWIQYPFFYLYGFLGVPNSVPSVTPTALGFPHSRWSKNIGTFFARTGFDSPADTVFHVTDGHFRFDGHGGPDDHPGFGLSKFGTLINTRYVAHRGYGNLDKYPGGQPKNIVYFEGDHTLARSSMHLPSEVEQASKGQGNFDHGGIEQTTVQDERFYHVRVDRTRMFQDGVKHTREYVFIPGENPTTDSDFLVVYDRTQAPSKPHWIYHVPWRPEVSNHSSTEDLTTGSGEADRIGTAYIGSNVIVKELNSIGGEKDNKGGTADNTGGGVAHGVVFSHTLLPESARVEVTRVAKLDAQVLSRQHGVSMKSNRWQVDVIPNSSSSEQRFLHVFETADANLKNTMTNTTLLEVGSQMQGAWIERENSSRPNHVVLFNKEEGERADVITYTVSGNGLVRHIVTGLKSSTIYQIEDLSNGSTQDKATELGVELWDYKGVETNNATGTIYFESTISGTHTYRLTPSGVAEDTIPPDTPSNVRISRVVQE